MTPEEIRALPVGALLTADGILYLICEERVHPFTGERLPVVIAWCPSPGFFTAFGGVLGKGTRLAIDFNKAIRIA